jgi:hypothetical protein
MNGGGVAESQPAPATINPLRININGRPGGRPEWAAWAGFRSGGALGARAGRRKYTRRRRPASRRPTAANLRPAGALWRRSRGVGEQFSLSLSL